MKKSGVYLELNMESKIKIEVGFTTESGFTGFDIGKSREEELGLMYIQESNNIGCKTSHHYLVVDKHKFFIGVIKYGISYKAFNYPRKYILYKTVQPFCT